MLVNSPTLWRHALRPKTGQRHKYDYGLAVIYAAPELTGATRLAAEACARVGVGLVTVLAPKATAAIYQASLPPHIMVRSDLAYQDPRVGARLYGSGGLAVAPDFSGQAPSVLDADALAGLPASLGDAFILTPHEGEFVRAFPGIDGAATRNYRALAAARLSGAVVVLKGAQTILAAADGRMVINRHASADLATAGSGDVLAGMITGLLARGLEPLLAAAAAVWMHGEAARRFGPGLVASDLPALLPAVLRDVASG
jgi:NAD(P)H-hydrate repair Nnr-like enzyme with NAD(P)H-hydrate dehydratase domain